MTTPKSPEEILSVFDNFMEASPMPVILQNKLKDWIRSSMASLLCYMAERMQYQPGDDYGYTTGIEKAESILIEEARKILEK